MQRRCCMHHTVEIPSTAAHSRVTALQIDEEKLREHVQMVRLPVLPMDCLLPSSGRKP